MSSGSVIDAEKLDEDSSLSVLDLNNLPDARHSVSLLHVGSKTSSIGSWLDQCFLTNGSDMLIQDKYADEDDKKLNVNVPCRQPLATSDRDEGDEANLLDFSFNEGDTEFDVLTNDDVTNTELDRTLVSDGGQKEHVMEFQQFGHNLDTSSFYSKLKTQSLISNSQKQTPVEEESEMIDDWQCKMPLDFFGAEFQQDVQLQNELSESDGFSKGDPENILACEERDFEKDNQLLLVENFVPTSNSDSNLNDFSTFRTSLMTITGDSGDVSRISIGAYIGERSCKLGHLGSEGIDERPSFGLAVSTPSPQRPCDFVNTSYEPKIEVDDSFDTTMVTTLSKAISNMSNSLDNEELAKLIIAMSNKKLEQKFAPLQQQHKKSLKVLSHQTSVPSACKDTKGHETVELQSFLSTNGITSSPSFGHQFLSSTQASVSLARGSISRESIEQLHRKLRNDAVLHELPDVISTHSSVTSLAGKIENDSFLPHALFSEGHINVENHLNNRNLCHSPPDTKGQSIPPLSQSSPDSPDTLERCQFGEASDINTTPLSNYFFDKLTSSLSCNEMPAAMGSEFNKQTLFPKSQFDTRKTSDRLSDVDKNGRNHLELLNSEMVLAASADSTVEPKPNAQMFENDLSSYSEEFLPQSDEYYFKSAHLQKSMSIPLQTTLPPVALLLDPSRIHPPQCSIMPSIPSPYSMLMSSRCAHSDACIYQRVDSDHTGLHATSSPMQPAPIGVIPYISVPSILTFEKPLCAGIPSKILLPLKNNLSRWVQVELRTISINMNGLPLTMNEENFFSMKHKHVIRPHSVEQTDLVMNGFKSGQCTVFIEVLSQLIFVEAKVPILPNPTCNVSSLKVFANIEEPSVYLYGCPVIPKNREERANIDFGELVCGVKKSLPLRILNESKVEVKVRLLLFSSFYDTSCFSVSLSSTLGTVTAESMVYDSETSGATGVLHMVLPVSSQPKIVWLHFIASTSMIDRMKDEKPVRVDGHVEVLLNTPFKHHDKSLIAMPSLLDSICVTALVGIGKLHTPKNQQVMSFSSVKGACQVKKVHIKNAGNIIVHVSFAPEFHSNIFTVKPTTAVLPPGGDVELAIECHFSSEHFSLPENVISTLLLMKILPSGPQFEIQLTASICDPCIPAKLASNPSPLLTNKSYLRWGCVPIRSSRQQKLKLRCAMKISTTFQASIKDATSSFQIFTDNSSCEELCTRCVMKIMAGQDLGIFVLFTPSQKTMVQAKLEIRIPIDTLPATKYTIPLMGYGGTSQIHIEDLDYNKRPFPSIYNDCIPKAYIMPIRNQNSGFTLKNFGDRSSFVKIVIYKDVKCSQIFSDVICNPAQFVLQENQSLKIWIETTGIYNMSTCFICIWHGDELSRQLMKLALNQQSSSSSFIAKCVPQLSPNVRSISFDGIFDGEDISATEEDLTKFEPHSVDVQLFYTNIKQTIVEMMSHNLGILSAVDSKKSVTTTLHRNRYLSHEKPERDVGFFSEKQPTYTSFTPSHNKSFLVSNWDVTPAHISLTLPSLRKKEDCIASDMSQVRILNHSSTSLFYDVVWPVHFVTVTPNRGHVEPESVAILLITANPSLTSCSKSLPWCGQVIISASNEASKERKNLRNVFLQIKNNEEREEKPITEQVHSDVTSLQKWDELFSALPKMEKTIIEVVDNSLDFGNATIGNTAKASIAFRNMSKVAIKWMLKSIAPSSVKSTEISDTGDIFQSSYATFVFSNKSGELEAGARLQVPVKFKPLTAGKYLQHWELKCHLITDHSALSLQREKIYLHGQGVYSQTVELLSNYSTPSRKEIYLSHDTYTFPETAIGKSSMIKIAIKNNGKSAHTILFINLKPPFHITHQKYTIRSKHCANLPVIFKAVGKGTYAGRLVIQTELAPPENFIHVDLKAKAV